MTSRDIEDNSKGFGATESGSLAAAGSRGPLSAARPQGPCGSPIRLAAGKTTRAPALTLSSWATWAFCRYMEYSTAVTTELVPSRINWARDGRDPLSMATPSSANRLEATRDPYAAGKPFPESIGPAPVDDEAITEVETAQETGRRRCRGDGDVAAASWENGRILGGPQGASASDSMTLSVPNAGRGHVGALLRVSRLSGWVIFKLLFIYPVSR